MHAVILCMTLVGFVGQNRYCFPRNVRCCRPVMTRCQSAKYCLAPSRPDVTEPDALKATEAPQDTMIEDTVIEAPPALERAEVGPALEAPASVASTPPDDASLKKPGFFTKVVNGRLWVFREGSDALNEFQSSGEPGKNVTMIGEGPNGLTISSSDRAVIIDYLVAKPGFVTRIVDGRLWVFEDGSEGLMEFEASGEPAKNVTLVGEGPIGMTIRSDERATIDKYLAK